MKDPLKKKQIVQFLFPYVNRGDNTQDPTNPGSGSSSGFPIPPTPPTINPELYQITNQEEFDEYCKGLCFISFLDTSDEMHENYISLLDEVANNYPKFSVSWIDGPESGSFKDEFRLPDGYPQALILQKKKLKYRVFTGAFEEELISEFLDSAISGRGRTATLDKIPSFSQTKEDL